MRKEQYAALRDWFDGYVESFRGIPGLGPWVDLKDGHTRRVAGIIVRIGKSLELPEEDLFLAGAVGLLHDVGRFSQIQRYGTFNDRRSENHALLGAGVLRKAGVLAALPAAEASLVLRAVERHNLSELPPDPDPRLSLFARLVQDADKLDILDMFTRFYGGEDGNFDEVLDAHLPDTQGCTAALVEDVLKGKLGSYQDVKNRNDRKILHLSWIYGIYFRFTLAEIERNRYVDRIIASLPATDVIREIHHSLRSYIGRAVTGGPGNGLVPKWLLP